MSCELFTFGILLILSSRDLTYCHLAEDNKLYERSLGLSHDTILGFLFIIFEP